MHGSLTSTKDVNRSYETLCFDNQQDLLPLILVCGAATIFPVPGELPKQGTDCRLQNMTDSKDIQEL